MSDGLTSTEKSEYALIIDEILSQSDLQTISAKAIRKGIQARVDHDISSKKQPITDLIMARFDKFNAEQQGGSDSNAASATNGSSSVPKSPPPPKATAATNGSSSKKRASPTSDDSDELSSLADSPPPKRKKIEKSREESDAEYAKRLQAELNRLTGRSTRGGGASAKRKPVVKKQRKKKSKAKIGSDEDSEVEGDEKKEVKRTGGFHKPLALSPQLAALVNETQLSRPQTVKKIWDYVKARDLQDPNDKRQIICDEAMRGVFKSDRIHMFTMNKVISQHLYDIEEQEAN